MRSSASRESGDETPSAALSGPAEIEVSGADRDILCALRAGDRRHALVLCARRHGAAIGRLCMALLGSAGEADDAVQETLLAAYDGFEGYRGEGSLLGWLLAIARRKCARQLERRVRRDAKLRLVFDADRTPAPSDELLARRRRAESARAALEDVRPSEREALLLRYVGELSYHDVALACGIDEVAARKRVSRALAQLRTLLVNEE